MITEREAQLLLDATATGMHSPNELANFMAQVAHESNGLSELNERFLYTKGISQITSKVRSALREGSEALELARVEALNGRPEQLAELMYGERMGNDQPGDAFKYHGRGYLQLTGKAQYREAGEALGIDFMTHPELAADPKYAGKIAIWYWNKNVHSKAAEDVQRATLIINGGENGLADRAERFESWRAVLTQDRVERLAKGDVDMSMDPRSQLRHDKSIQEAVALSLQTSLNALGYTDAQGRTLEIDGRYGNRTRYAVEAFQRDHGLSVDGVPGPKTWSALHDAVRAVSITPAAASVEPHVVVAEPSTIAFPEIAPPDLDTIAIRTLQQHLNALQATDHRGHQLPITGAYDEATRSAVSAFQQAQGLPDTGIADPATCGLIEARATIAQLQQSASMRMGPRHHDAGSPQDTLTIMQAQLQDMQRQMEAMTRQREHGREKDKAQDDSRAVSNEPTRDPTHQARREEASVSAEPLSYSNPHHPQHALYARLKELLPPGTSEARLAQSTAACYMGRITQPEQLHEIHIVRGAVHFLTTRPDAHASIDMTQPAPTVRQSMQQVQTYGQQQTQMWAQFQAQQVHAQHGSPMHASVLH